MNRFVLYFVILATGTSCSDHAQRDIPVSPMKDELKKTPAESTAPERTSLISASGFFWGHYKSVNRRLLNCGKTIPYTWKDTAAPGLKYNYCQFNGAATKGTHRNELGQSSVILQFAVWIKGKKAGLYSDSLNETLTAVLCRCSDPELKGFDLVNKTTDEITHELGKPDSSTATKFFYKVNDEVLRISFIEKKVTSFYWLKLSDKRQSFSSIDKNIPELPD